MKYMVKWIFIGIVGMLLSYAGGVYMGYEEFSTTGFIIAVLVGIPVGYVVYRDKKKFREYNKKSR